MTDPARCARPARSSVAFAAATLLAVLAPVGPLAGRATAAGATSVTADDAAGSTFHSVAPIRVLDTRYGTGAPKAPIAPRSGLTVALPSALVPSSATAVVMNVTVPRPGGPGHLTVYPGGTPEPASSNLNFATGETVPNLVMVTLGSGRTVSFHSSSPGTVDVFADLAGYYDASATGLRLKTIDPTRGPDPPRGIGRSTGAVRPHEMLRLAVRPSDVPAEAAAVVLNVTVT